VDQAAWLLTMLAYLSAHLGVYILVLRRLRAFGREMAIFLYHLASFCLLTGVTLIAAFSTLDPAAALALVVTAMAAHGIYSLSFLEVWSLAEGGYSLSVLRYVEAASLRHEPVDLEALHMIGASKKDSRVGGLLRLRLARRTGDCFELTPRGRVAEAAFRAIVSCANLRQLG
jgi:hypothetical protein